MRGRRMSNSSVETNERGQAAPEKVLPENRLLTVEEAALFLRLKPGTVRKMARQHRLPALKVGRGWRFLSSDLLALLHEHPRDV
jgi:excisionase family DNA binding protein